METQMSEYYHRITWKNSATVLASIFALASVQNTAHFFINAGHDRVASWTLGWAIGVALVIVAHFVGESDSRDKESFTYVMLAAAFVAIISTGIQGHAYSTEMGFWGYPTAFAIVATGEFLIPLAVAKLERAKKRRHILEADTQAENIAVQAIAEVMSGIDTTKAKRDAQKQISGLISAHVAATVTRLMPAQFEVVDTHHEQPMLEDKVSTQDMTEVRKNKADKRRDDMLDLALTQFDGQDVGTFKEHCIDTFSVSKRTVERDLLTLEESGLVVVNGCIKATSTFKVPA